MSGSHLTKLSLALALIGLAVGGSIARAETQEDMARDLVPAQKPLYQLGGVSPEAGYGVDAWVDRPDLHYRIGQQLRVFVRPRRTSYITVLNVGTSGRVSVIFPNFYQRESRVRAGGTVAIPSETSGWSINVAGPPGIELIKVIASREPLDLLELQRLARASENEPVLSLGRSGEVVARDLVPQLKSPPGSELPVTGVRNVLVRVLPRGAALPLLPSATQRLLPTFAPTLQPARSTLRVGSFPRGGLGQAPGTFRVTN